jgi:hypothetical protein
MRFIARMFKDWLDPLPPVAQGPAGLKVDSDFAPPEPGLLGTLFAWGSDGRVYTMDAADHKRLRPIILRSERAVKNEQAVAAARQRRARGENAAPITIISDGREYEPALPQAEILPPAPRPAPDWVDWDTMPSGGAGDGGHDK